MILKEGKDLLDLTSYRPISLAGVDYKILMMVLAMRLANILPDIKHPDQVGFISGRSSSDNHRRLLPLMWLHTEDDTLIAAFP